MLPIYSDHPLIRQFNELKRYFRRHETRETRARVEEFREFSRLISLAGVDMAFDFMGSMNFGQALADSDVDLVMYLDCREHDTDCGMETCSEFQHARSIMLETLIQSYADHPYELQVIDCINLRCLEREIDQDASESPILLRFAFYRSVCRLAGARLVRPYQVKLQKKPDLTDAMRPHLYTIFDSLVKSSPHTHSIEKYQQRLRDIDVKIPLSIKKRIRQHLGGESTEED